MSGTAKVGTKWTGAAAGGQQAEGLVKDGSVFYRKAVAEPPYVRLAAGTPPSVTIRVGETYQVPLETNVTDIVFSVMVGGAYITIGQSGLVTGIAAGKSAMILIQSTSAGYSSNLMFNVTA